MKSKTSLFNRTVFFNTLQRYWLGFAAYLCILGAVVVIPLVNYLQNAGFYPNNLPYYASLLQLLNGCITPVLFVNFFTVAVAAALLFSYLYNARHTGMMASLPIMRETMYLSVSAAAVLGMTLCNLAVILLALLVEVIYGQVHLLALGILLLVSLLSIVAFFGMAAFCCMLTGNILAGPAVFCIFNVLTLLTEAVISGLLQKVIFGLGYHYSYITSILSPVVKIVDSVNFRYDMVHDASNQWIDYTWEINGLGILAIYAVVGLVFLGLGMLLYKNRRMETAGDTISIEVLKPVFRFCMTVGGGLLFAYFISELLYEITPTRWMAAAYLAVLLIVGGILGYFISQMLITKTVNVFRKGWKVLAVYAAAVLLIMTAVESDLFGYERNVPEIKDIAQVTITGYNSDQLTFDEAENIEAVWKLHKNIINNKYLHETEYGSPECTAYMSQFDNPAAAFMKKHIQITYTLNNEEVIIRTYKISYGPDEILNPASEIRAYEAIINTAEGMEERYTVDSPVTLDNISSGWVEYVDTVNYESTHFSDFSPGELARLYNECILPDIADGKLGVIDVIEDKEYALSKYNCTIGLEFYKTLDSNEYSGSVYKEFKGIQVYPTLEASRTMAFLKEYGIEPAVIYDAQLAHGYDYNELGVFFADGSGTPMDDSKVYRGTMEVTAEATGEIIGGADGPTEIVITD